MVTPPPVLPGEPMDSMIRQKDMTSEDEFPSSEKVSNILLGRSEGNY